MKQISSKKSWGVLVAFACAAMLALSLTSVKAFAADVNRTAIGLGTTKVTLTPEADSAYYKFTAPSEGWYSFKNSNSRQADQYVRVDEELGGTFGSSWNEYENGTETKVIKLAAGQVVNYNVETYGYDENVVLSLTIAKASTPTDINSNYYDPSLSPVYLDNGKVVAAPSVSLRTVDDTYLIEGRDFTVAAGYYEDAANGNGYSAVSQLKLPTKETDEDGDTWTRGGYYYVKISGMGAYKGDRYISFRTENYRDISDLDIATNYYGIISGGKLQNKLAVACANLSGKSVVVPNALTITNYTDGEGYWDEDDSYVDGAPVSDGKFQVGEYYSYTVKAASGFTGNERDREFHAVDINGSAGTAYKKPLELTSAANKDVMAQPNKPVYVKFTAPADGHYFIGDIRSGSEPSRLYADAALNTPVLDYNLAKGQTVYALFNYSASKYDDPNYLTLAVLPNTELVVADVVKATGKAVTPAVSVKYLGKTLVMGKDYTVAYANNVKPGTATVTITGIGKYKNDLKLSKTFQVVAAKGKTYAAGALKYKVTNADTAGKGTVTVTAAVKGKSKTKTVKIPATVKIGNISYKVTAVGAKAFKGYTKLTKVTIGKNVKTIGSKAFYGAKKLTKVSGGAALTTIGTSSFSKCTKLTKITLGKKVKKIGSKAFYGDKKLKKITIKSSKVKVGKSAVKGISAKATIDVPNSKVKAYKKIFKTSTGFAKTMKVK